MTPHKVRKVVIAGGGTAGWMAAAALSKQLGHCLDITLIESDEIGNVGVGEATIPTLRVFHALLGIDEQAFLRATQGTFKLGIAFENWAREGDRYIHSFGQTGKECWAGEFHHFWLRGLEKGVTHDFGDYCYELQAAEAGKFATSAQSTINFAYHIDASLYGRFLRQLSEGHGVKRIEGKIVEVCKDNDSGHIRCLNLDCGQSVAGDLFIDCSGFKGLLIEQALHAGYEDWSHWLPCDTGIAVQTESVGPALPYTRSIARDCGWQWRIPLQHRVGNGLVYCSHYIADHHAEEKLLDNIQGEAITDTRLIRFRTGRRRRTWHHNCIALGLASGFVEPLESTSIHLISSGIIRLMRLFPFAGIHPSFIDEYNRQTEAEIEGIRDFIVLHYHLTRRTDSAFWRHCGNMDIPPSLAHRIDLFRESGRVFKGDSELFRVDSWTQVMFGQGIIPRQYHHIAGAMTDEELEKFLKGLKASIGEAVARLPDHQQFIDQYCRAAGT